MEDCGFIAKSEKPKVESASLKKLFDEQCPIYMSYGMSYDEFWKGSPKRAIYYRQMALIQAKRKDEECWMQGVYVYDALCRVSPILHAFSKSGTKPLPYVERPYMSTIEIDKQQDEETKRKIKENELMVAKLRFSQWARATAKKFKKEKEGEG